MTTLMRNGRDRRSGKPVKCHARKERALLVGTRSANHIRAGGHSGCTQRPDTWLHPNASRKRQIPLASRAPSIHGTSRTSADVRFESAKWAKADIDQVAVAKTNAAGTLNRKSVRTARRSLISDVRKLGRSCRRRCHKVQSSLFRKVSSSWKTPGIHSGNTIHGRSQAHLRKPRCGMRGDVPFG
jgi:hypothetical protein